MAAVAVRRVWFFIGNPLAGDDAVAARVLELLQPAGQVFELHQLTPEMAVDLAGASEAVFVDADVSVNEVRLELVDGEAASPWSHQYGPGELVALARELYGFRGKAWVCRVPCLSFAMGGGLSVIAEQHAHAAAKLLSAGSLPGA